MVEEVYAGGDTVPASISVLLHRLLINLLVILFLFSLKLPPSAGGGTESRMRCDMMTVTRYIFGPIVGPTNPTSAGDHCHKHYLFGMNRTLQM